MHNNSRTLLRAARSTRRRRNIGKNRYRQWPQTPMLPGRHQRNHLETARALKKLSVWAGLLFPGAAC